MTAMLKWITTPMSGIIGAARPNASARSTMLAALRRGSSGLCPDRTLAMTSESPITKPAATLERTVSDSIRPTTPSPRCVRCMAVSSGVVETSTEVVHAECHDARNPPCSLSTRHGANDLFGAVAVVGLLHAALLIGIACAAIEHRAASVPDQSAVH